MLRLVRNLLKRVLVLGDGPPEAPLGERPRVFRASTRHLTYLLAVWGVRMSFAFFVAVGALGFVAFVLAEEKQPMWIAGVLAAFILGFLGLHALVSYAAIRLDWQMRWYILTDRSLRIREGIVQLREVTLTLANVQEIKVSQGPLQRLLGITDLVVDTAGGGGGLAAGGPGSVHGHRGVLRGVERGSDLRQTIESRVKQRRGAGLGDPDEVADLGAPPQPAAGSAPTADDPFLEALRALRGEAAALRRSVS
jgi:uncharacterized membrane protein YdbT with pleckstrin-like domain